MGFPGGSDGKESTCNAGDLVQSQSWEDPLEEGHGNPLHYSCLENPMDRETCWATVHGAAVGRDFATEDTCTTGELLLEPSRISQ